ESLALRGIDGYAVPGMSREVWFVFLMFGLKVPVLGIGYFIYRVLRDQDRAWEEGGYGWDDDGGGGGGGGGPAPDPTPRSPAGPMRRRARRRRATLPALRPHGLGAPVRRPVPLRTRVR